MKVETLQRQEHYLETLEKAEEAILLIGSRRIKCMENRVMPIGYREYGMKFAPAKKGQTTMI